MDLPKQINVHSSIFSDLVVGETTCDGKKKMYRNVTDFKPVHVVELPNCQTEDGIQLYKKNYFVSRKF